MGKKYIIEIGRLERLYKAFIGAHGKPEITWLSPEVDLTPYTEPNLEQVRKEGYEKGLSDAWDAARKIGSELRYGLEIMGFKFEPRAVGDDPGWYVVQRHSASECIDKIRQYEQEKEEQDGLRQNIQTIVDQCGYTIDEIAEVLQKMKETNNGQHDPA